MRLISNFLIELLFPSFCLGCTKEGTHLCEDCRSVLEVSQHSYCLCNKSPLRLPPGRLAGTCSRCANKIISGMFFALPYKERFLTRKLIYQFKYEPYLRQLAPALAELLVEHFSLLDLPQKIFTEESILVPIPMDRKKIKARGYNQAEELAKELSGRIGLGIATENLVKIKATRPQMKLSAKERQENLKGAFAVKNPAIFKGKRVFLVDDVYTTGATMEECAHVLHNAGTKSIWGIAIAREER